MTGDQETIALDSNKRRVALVTGVGRASGIGAAICKALARHGCDIAYTWWLAYDRSTGMAVDPQFESELATELKTYGARVFGTEVNLSDPDHIPELFDRVTSELGPVSILVNNAAHSENGDLDSLTPQMIDAHLDVNARATALLTAEFARRWDRARGGRVINMTSGQSQGPMPGEIAYVMSKGAVEALTSSAAPDLAQRGITINAVDPGPTDTGWMSDELRDRLLQQFPMGRIGMPSDAANLVAFLASEEAGWITGQVIHSEGGFLRQ